jgi:hypothetical protein
VDAAGRLGPHAEALGTEVDPLSRHGVPMRPSADPRRRLILAR